LVRAADLVYYKSITVGFKDPKLTADLSSLLLLCNDVSLNKEVMRQLEGGKARQLMVAACHLGSLVPRALSSAILSELARDSGKKMPREDAVHMAELVWAMAKLKAGFKETSTPPQNHPRGNNAAWTTQNPSFTHMHHQQNLQVAGVLSSSRQAVHQSVLHLITKTRQRKPLPHITPQNAPPLSASSATSSTRSSSSPHLTQATISQQDDSTADGMVFESQRTRGDSMSAQLTAIHGPGAAQLGTGRGKRPQWLEMRICAHRALVKELEKLRARLRSQPPAATTSGIMPSRPSRMAWIFDDVEAPAPVLNPSRLSITGLSQIAWGFSTSNAGDPELFQVIEEIGILLLLYGSGSTQGCVIDPRALSNLAYAFAKEGLPCPQLITAICKAIAATALQDVAQPHPAGQTTDSQRDLLAIPISGSFQVENADNSHTTKSTSSSGQELRSVGHQADVAEGVSEPRSVRIQHGDDPYSSGHFYLGGDSLQGSKNSSQATPSRRPARHKLEAPHIAKILWASARLQFKDRQFLDAMSAVLLTSNLRFTADELAHIAWAFNAHGHCRKETFERLAQQFVAGRMYGISDTQLFELYRMYGISDTQLAMLAQSFAMAGHQNPVFYRTIARLASGRLDTLAAGELAVIAWALATMKQHTGMLMEAAAEAAKRNPSALNSRQQADLMDALHATGNRRCGREVMQAFMSHAQRRSFTVIPAEMSNRYIEEDEEDDERNIYMSEYGHDSRWNEGELDMELTLAYEV
ncbi:hypothetical protein CEUSTIGMA_g11190.t1, partial [Chlamydomonas eustigma]